MRTTIEQHRITCPYCLIGHAVIRVERSADPTRRDLSLDTKEPRRCTTCKQYFVLKPVLTIQGRKLEEV